MPKKSLYTIIKAKERKQTLDTLKEKYSEFSKRELLLLNLYSEEKSDSRMKEKNILKKTIQK